MFAWWHPNNNCPSQLWWLHQGDPQWYQPSFQNMIWQRRTHQSKIFHPWLKNVPHLLNSTMSNHTSYAEAEKRGAPGWCGLHIYVWVWVSMRFCCVYACVCVCVRMCMWIAAWRTMQHVKPTWEVWRQGICCRKKKTALVLFSCLAINYVHC